MIDTDPKLRINRETSEIKGASIPKSAYFPLLDAIRGVAALMVVIFHTHDLFGIQFHESFLAVDIFFVLSGVVIANAYGTSLVTTMPARRFMAIRLIRLYPLYLLSVLISIAATVSAGIFPASWSTACLLIATAVLVLPMPRGSELIFNTPFVAFPLNPPAWSLFYELLVNWLYALIARRLNPLRLYLIMFCSAIVLVIVSRHHTLDIGWTWNSLPAGVARVVYSFFAGVLITDRIKSYKFRRIVAFPSWLASLSILALTFGLLAASVPQHLENVYGIFVTLIVFPLLIFVATQVEISRLATRVALFFGVASYSIYVMHEPINRILRNIFTRSHLTASAPYSGIAFIAALLFISFVLDKYFDVPIRLALTRRLKR